MGIMSRGNYVEEPPDDSDYTKEEWLDLKYHQQYYRANNNKEKKIERSQKRRDRNYEWVKSIKKEESCRICGESRWQTLSFHHVDEKSDTISRLASKGYSIETIAEEIEKCIILCSNCHRVHHDGELDLDGIETGSEISKQVLNRKT